MKMTIKKVILFVSIILVSSFINAQEVFFKDNTRKLTNVGGNNVHPPNYYPLKAGNDFLNNFTYPGTTPLRIISGSLVTSPDRFGNNGQALSINGNGYVLVDGLRAIISQNYSFDFSCWLRFTDEVYNGDNEGMIFSIRDRQNSNAKALCTIKDKKITISVLRNKVSGGTAMVPIISMDVPVEKDERTNGFFFFGMTVDRFNGKRTKLYISRPGGVLFSRFYYTDPFEGFDYSDNDEAWMMGGLPSEPFVKAERMDDLMCDAMRIASDGIWKPEDILNNFYLQSPLYEGISYEIKNTVTGNQIRYLGLESQKNAGEDFKEEYLVLGDDTNKSPFGYNRFKVNEKPENKKFYTFNNMKMGGQFARIISGYVYMKIDGDQEYYQYIRDVSDPRSMYQVTASQFKLKREGTEGLLQSYSFLNKDWLAFGDPPNEEYRALFGISAAIKVARGIIPVQRYEGDLNVMLHNHFIENEIGEAIGKRSAYEGNFFTGRPEAGFLGFEKLSGQNIFKIWTVRDRGGAGSMRIDKGSCTRPTEDIYLTDYTWGPACGFELLYVKDDVNGMPQYILGATTGFSLSHGDKDGNDYHIQQKYKNKLNADGSVPKAILWSIKKIR